MGAFMKKGKMTTLGKAAAITVGTAMLTAPERRRREKEKEEERKEKVSKMRPNPTGSSAKKTRVASKGSK